MNAIKILVDEHDIILRMIDVTRSMLVDTSTLNTDHVEQVVDFIKNFADKIIKVIDAPSALPTELSSDLKIYPNPFDSFLVLNTADIMTYNLRITNVSGQIIYQANNITSPAISIDSSGYKPGMYLVEVTSQGKAAINKVIKL